MRAIKKPIPIEVEEFQPHRHPWPRQVRQVGISYVVDNQLHGSSITLQPGDYVNVSDPTGHDVYPIARDVFERTYDVVVEEVLEKGKP